MRCIIKKYEILRVLGKIVNYDLKIIIDYFCLLFAVDIGALNII